MAEAIRTQKTSKTKKQLMKEISVAHRRIEHYLKKYADYEEIDVGGKRMRVRRVREDIPEFLTNFLKEGGIKEDYYKMNINQLRQYHRKVQYIAGRKLLDPRRYEEFQRHLEQKSGFKWIGVDGKSHPSLFWKILNKYKEEHPERYNVDSVKDLREFLEMEYRGDLDLIAAYDAFIDFDVNNRYFKDKYGTGYTTYDERDYKTGDVKMFDESVTDEWTTIDNDIDLFESLEDDSYRILEEQERREKQIKEKEEYDRFVKGGRKQYGDYVLKETKQRGRPKGSKNKPK